MDQTPRPDLLAATRFVQAGRLTEATALLQRLLRGEPGPGATSSPTGDAPAGRTPPTIDLAAETIEVTDHQPASRTYRRRSRPGPPRLAPKRKRRARPSPICPRHCALPQRFDATASRLAGGWPSRPPRHWHPKSCRRAQFLAGTHPTGRQPATTALRAERPPPRLPLPLVDAAAAAPILPRLRRRHGHETRSPKSRVAWCSTRRRPGREREPVRNCSNPCDQQRDHGGPR